MDDILADLRAETAALDALLASLDADSWTAASACEGWTVSDVVLHLAQGEEAVVAAIDHGDAGRPFKPYLDQLSGSSEAGAVDALMRAAVEAERPDDPADVLPRWRESHAGALERLETVHPKAQVPWIAGGFGARTLATTRLAEHWVHGTDIRRPLGLPPADGERLHNVAWLAWRTLPYAFELAGEESAPGVRLELVGPTGQPWIHGSPDAEVTIRGSGVEWCLVAGRRVPGHESSLETHGARAADVLRLVRTYA